LYNDPLSCANFDFRMQEIELRILLAKNLSSRHGGVPTLKVPTVLRDAGNPALLDKLFERA
jgi:hypothetical protein